jgi:hypothetical protein
VTGQLITIMAAGQGARGSGAHRLESVGGVEEAVEFLIVRGGRYPCKIGIDRDVVRDHGFLSFS